MIDGHLAFGLICSAFLVGFLLYKARRAPLAFLATIIGVAVILVVCTHWEMLTASLDTWLTPAQAPVVVAHQASVHTAPTHSLTAQATPTTKVHTITIHLAAPTPSLSSSVQQTTQEVLAFLEMLFQVGLIVLLFLVILFLVVVRQRSVANAHSLASKPKGKGVCLECAQVKQVRAYRYRSGATRITGRLCDDCAGACGGVAVEVGNS